MGREEWEGEEGSMTGRGVGKGKGRLDWDICPAPPPEFLFTPLTTQLAASRLLMLLTRVSHDMQRSAVCLSAGQLCVVWSVTDR